MTDLPAEARLVFACARPARAAHDTARVASLARGPIDWNGVRALATRHGLAGVVHRELAAGGIEIPTNVEAALWARAQWSARRADRLAGELERVALALTQAGVGFVPFKGPVLAERVHGGAPLREFGDLDILVAPDEVRRARWVLGDLGYEPQLALGSDREDLWLRSALRHELPLVDRRRGLMLELQWRANPGFGVPAIHDPAWWEHAPQAQWHGITMRAMPEDEHLVALLVHGSKHAWASADWLVDIAAIASGTVVPWNDVMRLAREHGAMRRAALGLDLANRLLGLALPDDVSRFVRDAGTARIADAIAASLASPAPARLTLAANLRRELQLLDHPSQRLRRVASLLQPTPGDWTLVRMPRPLFFLYWIVRPARLFAKYVLRLGAGETQLPPRFEDDDGDRIGEVQAAVARAHRQP